MWNLQKPLDMDAGAHLDVAFQEGEISAADKAALLALYGQYEEARGRPSEALKAAELNPALHQHVHDAYDLVQDGRRLRALRASLKQLASYCPYCGFGQISQLDHLLQRKHFKLFSIFALNLVPCCSPCNNGKRRDPSANPLKHQVHVYLEDVSQLDFLRAHIAMDADTGGLDVRYAIEQCLGMSDELYSRLVFHLEEFNLQSRFAMQTNIYLGELAFPFEMSYVTSGGDGLRAMLRGCADSNKKNFGTNDWRTALMYGLADCAAFCDGGFRRALGKF